MTASFLILFPLKVTYGGVSLPESPFRVGVSEACDPQAVVVKGPGVDKGVLSNTPTHFDIDCRKAGPGQFLKFIDLFNWSNLFVTQKLVNL